MKYFVLYFLFGGYLLLYSQVDIKLIGKPSVINTPTIGNIEGWAKNQLAKLTVVITNNGYPFTAPENIYFQGNIKYGGIQLDFNRFRLIDCNFNYANDIYNKIPVYFKLEELLNCITISSMGGFTDILNQIVRSNQIPEGDYEACLQIYDNDFQVASSCETIEALRFQSCQLIQPYEFEVIEIGYLPLFRWTSILPTPPNDYEVFYNLKVVEANQSGDIETQFFNGNPLFTIDQTKNLSIQGNKQASWPSEMNPPMPGKSYIWSVQALVRDNLFPDRFIPAVTNSNGFAKPQLFTVKENIPKLLAPSNYDEIYTSFISFKWLNNTTMLPNIPLNKPLRLIIVGLNDANQSFFDALNSNNLVAQIPLDYQEEISIDFFMLNNLQYKFYAWALEYFDLPNNRVKITEPNIFFYFPFNQNAFFSLISPQGDLSNPNSVTFTWEKNNSINSEKIAYSLYCIEINPGQDIYSAINNNQFVIQEHNIKNNSFTYLANKRFPLKDKVYAWTVGMYIEGNPDTYVEALNGPFFFQFPVSYDIGSTENFFDFNFSNCFDEYIPELTTNEPAFFTAESLIGKIINIGGFEVLVTHCKVEKNKIYGKGKSKIPILGGGEFDCIINELTLNRNLEALSGNVFVEIDEEVPFYFYTDNNVIKYDDFELVRNGLLNIDAWIQNKNTAKDGNVTKLPLILNQVKARTYDSFNDAPIIVTNLVMYPSPWPSKMDAFTVLRMPEINHKIIFAGEINITKNGFYGNNQNSRIFLKAWNSNFSFNNLNIFLNNQTDIYFDCDGNYKISLDMDVEFPYLNDRIIYAKFQDTLLDWDSWVIPSKKVLIKDSNQVSYDASNEIKLFFDNSDELDLSYTKEKPIKGIFPSLNSASASKENTNLRTQNFDIADDKIQPIFFPLGTRKFDKSFKWIFDKFEAKYNKKTNSVEISWIINPKLPNNFRVILYKSRMNNGLRIYTEIFPSEGSNKFTFVDTSINQEDEFYKYAIKVLSDDGEDSGISEVKIVKIK